MIKSLASVALGMLKRIPPFLRNKYAAVLIGFVVYIVLFDAHDLISQISIKMELRQIRQEIDYLNQTTADAKIQIEELSSDDEKLEKFAREQYRMKRENEDLYVLIYE